MGAALSIGGGRALSRPRGEHTGFFLLSFVINGAITVDGRGKKVYDKYE